MLVFLIGLCISCPFIILGIYAFNSKKEAAFGFWANAEVFPVNNIKSYNRAMGKLWCTFGAILAVLGLPLLKEQNSPYILLSILGVMAESIVAMAVYVTVIEKKYRKKP